MTYLIDTHVLLWFFNGSAELSATAKEILADPESDIVIHSASLWEAAIKKSIGKLDVDMHDLLDRLESQSIHITSPELGTIISLSSLPFPTVGKTVHKDPFDRIIAATVIANPEYRLISCDAIFDFYGVSRIW